MITQCENKVNTYLATDGLAEPCLIISNAESGKSKKPSPEKLMSYFDLTKPFVIYDGTQNLTDFTDIIVSGGDGTISNAINLCNRSSHNVYYAPTGTVNDFGKIDKQTTAPILGKANDKIFCYVYATGTFTAIGYTAKRNTKKKIGRLAYYIEALKQFEIQRIKANVRTEEEFYSGEFTLVMVLRSPRCFGFRFNKLYDPNKEELYLLTVKSPKNRFSLFLKFFRCFFIGFDKPYDKNGIFFANVKTADINFENKVDFCIDGDKEKGSENVSFVAHKFDGSIVIKK